MPEHIYAIFAHVDGGRGRARSMFFAAGLADQMVARPPAIGMYKIELSAEEAAQRLAFAARANGLPPPHIQRYLPPTAKELAQAPLLYLSVGGPGSERGHPRA